MSTKGKHWTNKSTKDFAFSICVDFVTQIEEEMGGRGMSKKDLARLLKIPTSEVSKIINNPSKLTLHNIVEWSRALGLKVSIVSYSDGDKDNNNGPIFSGIFEDCWKVLGKPKDNFDMEEIRNRVPNK